MKQINILIVSLFIVSFIGFSLTAAGSCNPEVYQAQKLLKEFGYNPGKLDGLWGKATQRVVERFQHDVGLPVTGRLDEQTKARLGIRTLERGIKIKEQVKERRLALIIGNGNYKSAPLRNPVNDARDIAQVLKTLRFEVIHNEDVNQRSMEDAIRGFGNGLKRGGVGLFYFAGHGMQVNGRNYLIPIGAEIREEADIKYEAVDAGRILDAMYNARNSLNIVILDACRDNPLARSFRTSAGGLARMDAPTGTLIAYSTAPHMVAADGEGRNAIYTKHLLKYITTPGLTIEQVLKKVRVEVINETDNKQVPWESSSLTGDFYFVPKRVVAIKRLPTAKMQDSTELDKERQQLDRKRQELERLKMETERKRLEAERKILEAEKQKLQIAKLPPESKYSPPAYESSEVGRDGMFIAYANGIVKHRKTGLEWIAGPDEDTTWDEAKRWVESLTVAGGGWRMPTVNELRTLFEWGLGIRNTTSLLKTTGWRVWPSNGGPRTSQFAFDSGLRRLSLNSKATRVFAVRCRNSIGIDFVYISPGTFMMGSPPDELGRDVSDEKYHRVTLTRGFHIQTTEVTQGQWKRVIGSTPSCRNPSCFERCDDCPVGVLWNDSQEFIRKLNQMEATDKYRLPTEAEWEYACRAWSTTAFANGGISELECGYDPNLDAMGWYCGNSGGKTHPVAQKEPNAWGLYDMHGNLYEWCQNWYGDYPSGHVIDPKGPSYGPSRVSRSCSCIERARFCRSANRAYGYGCSGFRLAKYPQIEIRRMSP